MESTDNREIGLDFGAGNVVALHSHCLRITKEPTACDLCATLCPAAALEPAALVVPKPPEAPKEETQDQGEQAEARNQGEQGGAGNSSGAIERAQGKQTEASPVAAGAKTLGTTTPLTMGVKVHEHCLHCGLCVAVCPVEGLTATKHHTKGFEKLVTEKQAEAKGIAVGCARALFDLPARLSSQTLCLPCLASLTPETWFFAAACARDASYEIQFEQNYKEGVEPAHGEGALLVYLPPFICEDCPVNAQGKAEEAFAACIASAEAWGAHNIELVTTKEELDPQAQNKLVNSLGEVSSGDKRELLSQLTATFSRTWQNAGIELEREKNKLIPLVQQRKKIQKRAKVDVNAPRPFGKKSFRKGLLRTALEDNSSLAAGVSLLVSGTRAPLCTGCGTCVRACPLDARKLVSGNSVLYFAGLPLDERPQAAEAAITDQLCCLGCSACVQHCPTGACTLTTLSGSELLKLRES